MIEFDFTTGTVTTNSTNSTGPYAAGTTSLTYIPITPKTDCIARDEWPAGQRWFVRADDWLHAHAQHWYWLWRPLCSYVDRYHRRGI